MKSFSYDTAGRTTGVTVSGNTTTVAYDYEGRITTITYPNSSTNTFTYNGLDTRVGKVDSGGTKTFLRDGAGVTSPVLDDASAVFTPGTSERRSGTTTYYHNGFKDAESQTGTAQTVTATQTFDAFGNPDTSSGTWKGPFAYGGPFGYQSDGDSGLKLLGHRYYDSSTGRFLTRDNATNRRNWYAYCQNNATSSVDSNGQIDQKILTAIFRGIDRGVLDDDTADLYRENGGNNDFAQKVHRALQKTPGAVDDNPDVDESDIIDAAKAALQCAINPTSPYPLVIAPTPWWEKVNWKAVIVVTAIVVVAVAASAASGGTGTGGAVAGGMRLAAYALSG